MPEYYECHITIRIPGFTDKHSAKEGIEAVVLNSGWKFSCIDGDPVLGKEILCYATTHFKGARPREEIKSILHATANSYRDKGCDVIREKIELVVYDTKRKEVEHA